MKDYRDIKNNKPKDRGVRVRTRHYGTFRRESHGFKNFKINKRKNA